LLIAAIRCFGLLCLLFLLESFRVVEILTSLKGTRVGFKALLTGVTGLSALALWHRPCSGLSWLAMYIASVRALVALYRRTGALPASRFRQEKHVEVLQVLD
jgi:hypothetical protein